MSVRFKLSDINEKQQNKLEKYLTFTPKKVSMLSINFQQIMLKVLECFILKME